MRLLSFINKSIQRKMFFYLILATVFPTAIIGISSYLISIEILKNKVSDSVVDTLGFIKNGIENEMKQVEQISSYMFINTDIKKILAKDFVENTPESYYEMVKASESFSLYSIHSRNFSYISSIQVLGENRVNLLYGEEVGNFNRKNLNEMKTVSWYDEMEQLNGKIFWVGKDDNYISTNAKVGKKQMVSMARTIKDMNMVDNVGMIYISLDSSMFQELLRNSSIQSGGKILIFDNHDEVVYSSDNFDLNQEKQNLDRIISQQKQQGYLIDDGAKGKQLTAYYYISRYGWWVKETISYNELIKDNKLIFKMTITVFIVCLLLSGIVWYLLSCKFVRPIIDLIVTMRSIREGNLVVKSKIQSDDEIGVLSNSYNYMIERIHSLFQKVLEEQEMKKTAEYKALQAQINPHFLLNTLNSIRWMAMIQKADNIKETIDALGRMLENSTNSIQSFISIEEEIHNVMDYLFIQKIRYKDKFDVVFDVDEQVLKCECIKFILQPLVENAIFHGIEPKPGFGMIHITVRQIDENIKFIVRDDGMGMDEHKINEILKYEKRNGNGFNGIGIQNVNERVKMTYGEYFGITIRSSLHEFTEIELLLPVRYASKEDRWEHVKGNDYR